MRRFFKLLRIILKPYYCFALLNGVAAGVEHEKFLKNIKCNHLVDIGANRGQFSLVAKRLFPNIKITAFEPLSEPASKFISLFKRYSNVKLHQIAIGPDNKKGQIHIAARDYSSSLLPIDQKHIEIYPNTQEIGTREVTIKPLAQVLGRDDFLDNALLKIDVQGYELEVLKGCEELLELFDYLYIECSFIELYKGQAFAQDIIKFLTAKGFYLRSIYNIDYSKDGFAVQGDFFFQKK